MLTAKHHIARLQIYCHILNELAKQKKTKKLIKELRGFRADTSWLIDELVKGRCKPS